MIEGAQVVAEVHANGEVVVYDPSNTDAEVAASFLSSFGVSEYRNFFLATLTLTPLQEM